MSRRECSRTKRKMQVVSDTLLSLSSISKRYQPPPSPWPHLKIPLATILLPSLRHKVPPLQRVSTAVMGHWIKAELTSRFGPYTCLCCSASYTYSNPDVSFILGIFAT